MTKPSTLQHLLLVDDSDAVLSYEKAALGSYYLLTTATGGEEALAKAAEVVPDGILLDLSMPGMNGDEVLRHLKNNPALKHIPVIIVSSEKERAARCIEGGAASYLPKPVRAEALRQEVARVLEQAIAASRSGDLGVLLVAVGTVEVALPLTSVDRVVLQPATQMLGVWPTRLQEVVDLEERLVPVLDLAQVFRVSHTEALEDRKLVVVHSRELQVALGVDRVRDPQDVPRAQVTPRESLTGTDAHMLNRAITAVIRADGGPCAVLDPAAFFSRSALRGLHRSVAQAVLTGSLPSGVEAR